MRQFNAILNPGDYDELLKEILGNFENFGVDRYERLHLQYNINYYPYLIAAAKRAIENEGLNEIEDENLKKVKQKLEALNNVFPPGNLPASIVNDEQLRKYLDSPGYKPEELNRFETHIDRIIENTTRAKHLPIYEWCRGQTALSYKRHKATCKEPGCRADEAFEKRVEFFERRIEDLQRSNPGVEPLTTPITLQIENLKFTLSERPGAKIDLIRIINAMWGVGLFKDEYGRTAPKQALMKAVGGVFGVDLSDYDKDLHQAYKATSIEANIKIFKNLEEFTINICSH